MKKIFLVFMLTFIMSLGNSTNLWSKNLKTIDVNSILKTFLTDKKNIKYIKDNNLKAMLNNKNYKLKDVKFNGNVTTNIKYDTSSAKIKNGKLVIDDKVLKKPEIISTGKVVNRNKKEQKLTMNISETISTEESWENSVSINLGIAVEYDAGIPLIGGSKTSVSFEAGYENSHTSSKGKDKTYDMGIEIAVSPKHQCEGHLLVQKLDLKIPYTIYFNLTGKVDTIFEKVDQRGVEFFFDSNYSSLRGFYKIGDYPDIGGSCNQFSSYKVNGDVKAIVYSDKNFRGRQKTITKTEWFIGTDWNDDIESIKITGTKMTKEAKKLTFDLKNINSKTVKEFTVTGTWSGVSAYNGFAVIDEEQPIPRSLSYSKKGKRKNNIKKLKSVKSIKSLKKHKDLFKLINKGLSNKNIKKAEKLAEKYKLKVIKVESK